MNYLYLFLTIIFMAVVQATRKSYDGKHPGGGVFIFTTVCCLFSALFFTISSGFKLSFTSELIPYALSFGACYGLATVFSYYAIRTGPLSLTSLISSYSLVIPTAYSIFFFGDTPSVFFYIGLALLGISLFAIGFKGKSKEDIAKITPLWVINVALAFVTNGGCSTIQTVQQKEFDGAYKSELMIVALLSVSLALTVVSLITERPRIIQTLKTGIPYAAVFGIVNGAVNLFVMLLTSSDMPASLVFPLISAGGLITTSALAVTIYREKLSRLQTAGLILGIGAVIFMNI